MTITWGQWATGKTGNAIRLGLEVVNTSAPTNTSPTFYATYRVYSQNLRAYKDAQTLSVTGTGLASTRTNFTNNASAGAQVLRGEYTVYFGYPADSYGGNPGAVYLSASILGADDGSSPGVTLRWPITPRPYSVPAAPTGVTAKRVTDAQAVVSWTNHATASGAYQSVTVQRRWRDSAGWSDMATLSGAVSTWTDNGNKPDKQIAYRVRATNSAGSSGWSDASPSFFTTPDAPSSAYAYRRSDGVVIGKTGNPGWGNYGYVTYVQMQAEGSSSWQWIGTSQLDSQIGTQYTTILYRNPPAGTVRYRAAFRALDTAGNTGPLSAWTYTNTVSEPIAPLAPSNLSPNGPVDVANAITVTWQHNPGSDAAPQTKFRLRWSTNSGASWKVGTTQETSAQTATFPAGMFTAGSTVLWGVQTWGVYQGWSPWSASAVINPVSKPVVTITSPAAAAISQLPVRVTWEFSQSQGRAQEAYRVLLYQLPSAELVWDSGDVYSSLRSVDVPVGLNPEVTYDVAVKAKGVGTMWSDAAEKSFRLDLLPPPPVAAVAQFDQVSGAGVLTIKADAPVAGESVAIATVDVERRINDGEWTRIITGMTLDPDDWGQTLAVDLLPSLYGRNEYRLVVTSLAPSVAVTDSIFLEVRGWEHTDSVYLNWGPGLASVEAAACGVSVSETRGRDSATFKARGRAYPVALLGDTRSREVKVQLTAIQPRRCVKPEGEVDETFTGVQVRDEWLAAAENADVVVFRDFAGRRVFGILSNMDASDLDELGDANLTFTVTAVDYDEEHVPSYVPTDVYLPVVIPDPDVVVPDPNVSVLEDGTVVVTNAGATA